MDKEKEIATMANIIESCVKPSCEECVKFDRPCSHYKNAEKLFNAGYRKADEVRQGTAKRIFDLLEKLEIEGKATLPKGFLSSGRRAYGIDNVIERKLPYGIGDKLYFIRDNQVIECEILSLTCSVNGVGNAQVFYTTNTPYGDYTTVEDVCLSAIGTRYLTTREQAAAKIRGGAK